MEDRGPFKDKPKSKTSPKLRRPWYKKRSSSLNGAGEDKKHEIREGESKVRPERLSTFKDYLRVFTYGTKLDVALMIAGAIASIAAGVVRQPLRSSSFATRKCSLTSSRA